MRPVRVFPLLLVLALLLPLGSAQAQRIRSSLDIPRPDWGLEASFSGQYTNYDFEQVNSHLENGPDYYRQTSLVYDGSRDQQSFEAKTAMDIRFGGRYKGIRFGGGFTNVPEQQGGFTMYTENNAGVVINTEVYDITVSAREFYGYAGYLHPINRRFEVGAIATVGLGFVDGDHRDEINHESRDVSVEGGYTPVCVELRGLFNLTRYVALHVNGGMRWANSTDTEGDFGVAGVTGIEGSSDPLIDYNHEPLEFDYSGWYIGGGLTLKNPFDRR